MTDNRIMKYNVDFCFRDFKYSSGCVTIDFENLEEMKGRVIADWSIDYATKHLMDLILLATGIKGGWTISEIEIENNKLNKHVKVYNFTIQSRLYKTLRGIYDRR